MDAVESGHAVEGTGGWKGTSGRARARSVLRHSTLAATTASIWASIILSSTRWTTKEAMLRASTAPRMPPPPDTNIVTYCRPLFLPSLGPNGTLYASYLLATSFFSDCRGFTLIHHHGPWQFPRPLLRRKATALRQKEKLSDTQTEGIVGEIAKKKEKKKKKRKKRDVARLSRYDNGVWSVLTHCDFATPNGVVLFRRKATALRRRGRVARLPRYDRPILLSFRADNCPAAQTACPIASLLSCTGLSQSEVGIFDF
ncbi:hypothetical protein ARMSODRAFT_766797 [Armillaria solidipes]|uniref:Uncharacterized protein n=1 Tax=Armillaria solidipes TaxID=1076256 RepID=A0A2H3AQF6_9AGAR|nr:hypothetical protein ARMSODRAFT_766797 [Armillaria solidipes]